MSVTSEQRQLIKGIRLTRSEVCAILDMCRPLLRSIRKAGAVQKTVTTEIDHRGYSLSRWGIQRGPLLQKLSELDDLKESALLCGLEVLDTRNKRMRGGLDGVTIPLQPSQFPASDHDDRSRSLFCDNFQFPASSVESILFRFEGNVCVRKAENERSLQGV
jgi:hypothetical protein